MTTRKPRASPQLNEDKLRPRDGRYNVPKKQRPKFNGDELRAQLQSYDRRPFLELLSEWINSCPDPDRISEFADKHPDKYISAMSSLARIAGFTEKTETLVDVTVNYRALSDSQLEDRLAQLQQQLTLPQSGLHGTDRPQSQVVDAEIISVQNPEPCDPGN